MKESTFYSNYEDNNVTVFRTKEFQTLVILSMENQTIYISEEISESYKREILFRNYFPQFDITYLSGKEIAKYNLRLMS